MTFTPSSQADPQESPTATSTAENPSQPAAPPVATDGQDASRPAGDPPAPAAAKRRGIGSYFWGTIYFLIAVTGLLVILALLRPDPGQLDGEAEQPQVSHIQEALTRIQQQTPQFQERALQAGRAAVVANIDDAMDQIFQPVHAAIPGYADFHYTVWGQYAELLTGGAETLGIEKEVGSIMREKLFVGFEDRYLQQVAHLNEIYLSAANKSIETDAEQLAGETGEPMSEELKTALKPILADTKQRMRVTVPTGAAATVAVAVIVKPIATKIVASTAAKVVGKTVIKYTGIGGGAAGGALAGSFFGPVGAAVGGVGGAAAAWLIADYTVVALDEYFFREDFEAELAAAIDDQKAALQKKILRMFKVET